MYRFLHLFRIAYGRLSVAQGPHGLSGELADLRHYILKAFGHALRHALVPDARRLAVYAQCEVRYPLGVVDAVDDLRDHLRLVVGKLVLRDPYQVVPDLVVRVVYLVLGLLDGLLVDVGVAEAVVQRCGRDSPGAARHVRQCDRHGLQGHLRGGEQMRFERDRALAPVVGDYLSARFREKRYERGEDDHVGHVEQRVGHGDVSCGVDVFDPIALREARNEMEECRCMETSRIGYHDEERADEQRSPDQVEQRVRKRRPARVRVRSDGGEGGRDRGADVVAEHDRHGGPDVDESRTRERYRYADRRGRALHDHRAYRADRYGAEHVRHREES